jgi:hypothetical protein
MFHLPVLQREHNQQREWAESVAFLSDTRYLLPRKLVSKTEAFYRDILTNLDPARYGHFFRACPESMAYIVSRIEDHPVFHSNSFRQQAPVPITACRYFASLVIRIFYSSKVYCCPTTLWHR